VGVLEDVASIRGHAVVESDLLGGADGRIHGARVAIRARRKKPFLLEAAEEGRESDAAWGGGWFLLALCGGDA
jgi:hypothetical protein